METGRPTHYTCIDLFAGAGGFTLGAEAAGFRVLGTVESDEVASRTLATNFPDQVVSYLGPRQGDITRLDFPELRRALQAHGAPELDLLISCPPCQGFSRIGRGKLDSLADTSGAFAFDTRNLLYQHAVEAVRQLRPRAFVFENVVGILHLRGRNVAEDVCEALARSGYHVRCSILNSASYGVPQTRERIVIVGFRADLAIEPCFPARTHDAPTSRGQISMAELNPTLWRDPLFFLHSRDLPAARILKAPVTVAEAFDDLPPFTGHLEALHEAQRYRSHRRYHQPVVYARPPRNSFCAEMRRWGARFNSVLVSDHFCRWTPRDFDTFRTLPCGAKYGEAHEIALERYRQAVKVYKKRGRHRPARADFVPPYPLDSFADKWHKLIPTQPSWTVTAHLAKDTYSHIHFDPDQARAITPREAARLQSFPDAFQFHGNTGDMFRQIGNAVPPLLARAICNSIVDAFLSLDHRQHRRAGSRRHKDARTPRWISIQAPRP